MNNHMSSVSWEPRHGSLFSGFFSVFGACFGSLVFWTFLLAAVVLVPRAGAQSPSPEPGDGVLVVARVAGEPVTLAEVEKVWRREDPFLWLRNASPLYQARAAALQVVLAERVLSVAAEAEGMELQEFIAREVERVSEVPPEDVVEREIRQLARTQPAIPPDFRRNLAVLQLQERFRVETRVRILAQAYAEADIAGAFEIFLHPPRVDELGPGLDSPSWGADAGEELVTIQVFSDFTCPYCARLAPRLDQLVEDYPEVRVVFRFFPAASRQGARAAAEAASCAAAQGRFDPFHDGLFADQSIVASGSYNEIATRAAVALPEFVRCISDGDSYDRVQEDLELGSKIGVRSTPTTLVNGRPILGAQEYRTFTTIVEDELRSLSR